MKNYQVYIVISEENGTNKLLSYTTKDFDEARRLLAEFTDPDWTAFVDIEAPMLNERIWNNRDLRYDRRVYKNSFYGIDKSEYCGSLIKHVEYNPTKCIVDFKEIIDAAKCDDFSDFCKEFAIE